MRRDPSNFIEHLYLEHRDFLTRYARRFVEKPDATEEIIQITFCIALKRIDTLMDHENPVGWLMVVVKNLIKKHREEQARYGKYFVDYDPEWADAPSADPANNAEAKDMVARIRKLLGEKDFYLVKRVLYDDATHLTVSQELGISVTASRKRLSRALKKITEAFPEK